MKFPLQRRGARGRGESAVSSVFYAPPEKRAGDAIYLPPDEAHHAMRVRRIRPDDVLVVVDGEGGWYRAVAAGSSRDPRRAGGADAAATAGRGEPGAGFAGHLPLRIVEERREIGESPWRLTLAVAVPKGKAFETVVEKATELGVAAIVPLTTARVVVRREPGEGGGRQDRWQRIALAAMKQCGRSRLPGIQDPMRLADLAGRFSGFSAVLIASGPEESRTVESAIRELAPDRAAPGAPSLLALVGPEGGFTSEEEELAIGAGAAAVTLGPRTLRTETAAVAIAALVESAMSDAARGTPVGPPVAAPAAAEPY